MHRRPYELGWDLDQRSSTRWNRMARFVEMLHHNPGHWGLYETQYRLNNPNPGKQYEAAAAALNYAREAYPAVEWEVRGNRIYGRIPLGG